MVFRFAFFLFFSMVSVQALAQQDYRFTYLETIPDGVGEPAEFALWVPERAGGIRALIVASQGRMDQIVGHPSIREMARHYQVGLLSFRNTSFESEFDTSKNHEEVFQAGLDALARSSGFSELAHAPFFTYGTSVGGIFAYQFAFWKPQRMLGIIEDNAIWTKPPSYGQRKDLLHVPMLVSRGDVEPVRDPWMDSRDSIIKLRQLGLPVSMLLQANIGHFLFTDFEAAYLAEWIPAVMKQRLPETEANYPTDQPFPLRPLKIQSGYLSDTVFKGSMRLPRSYTAYDGKPSNAFWHIDSALALLWYKKHKAFQDKSNPKITVQNEVLQDCANTFEICYQWPVDQVPAFQLKAASSHSVPVEWSSYNGWFYTKGDSVLARPIRTKVRKGWVVAYTPETPQANAAELPLRLGPVLNEQKGSYIRDTTTSKDWRSQQPIGVQRFFVKGKVAALPAKARVYSGAAYLRNSALQLAPFPRGKSRVISTYYHPSYQNLAADTFEIVRLDQARDSSTGLFKAVPGKKSKPKKGIYLYPNPFGAFLVVQNAAGSRYTLKDAAGRVVREGSIHDKHQRLTWGGTLPAGSYQFSLVQDQQVYQTSLIKH